MTPSTIKTRALLKISYLLVVFLVLADAESKLPRAADRIRDEPESVWVEFIQLASDHKPLNLGQGFPDFAAPEYLVESLQNATNQIGANKVNLLNHQYTRSFGHPRLVRALRDYYKIFRNFSELTDEKDQLLVTVGAYEALFTAIMAFVNPGDEVLLIDPAFDAYDPMVRMAGGKSVFVPLRQLSSFNESLPSSSTNDFGLHMEELAAKINEKTRLLVLNTPNNPLGKVFDRPELEQIARLCIKNNILVVADEVYEHFYYDSSEHLSIASLPGMWERTVTIGSAGKTFSVTGWKIGWAFGARHLIRYMQLVHQTAVYTVATPLQEAIARALEREMSTIADGDPKNQYWTELRHSLLIKRNRMAKILERARLKPIVPQGGYFMMADFSQLGNRFPEYRNSTATTSSAVQTNDYQFARWLSREKHLQGIPGGAFYSSDNKSLGANLIRLCFIKSDTTLDKFEKLIDQLTGL